MRVVKPLLLLGCGLLFSPVWAVPDPASDNLQTLTVAHHKGMHGGGYMMKMLKKLELSDEQMATVEQLMAAHREKQMAQKSAMYDQMKALMDDPVFDEAKATSLIKEQETMRLQRRLDRMKLHHDIYQELTDSQRARLGEMRQDWREKRKGRWQKG